MGDAVHRDPLTELTASAAVQAMRSGELRAVSYASALLDAAQASVDLNAFITLDPEAVLDGARLADKARSAGAELGALHGLPIAVKDSVHVAGMPATNGTKSLADFRPRADAEIVTRLREAGALVLGKTNMTELSFGWTSNNGTFGPVHNPYHPDLVPGGSSGGSAAAVSGRIAPLAIGADTLGSIRIPAAFCGVVGFRPTFGRYPNGGAFGLTDDKLDQLGPLARSVEDIALFDTVLSGAAPALPKRSLSGVRIGVPPFYHGGIESTVRAVTDDALAKLLAAGAVLVDVDVSADIQTSFDVAAAIMLFESMPSVSRYLETNNAGVTFDELVSRLADGKREFFTSVVIPPGRPPREAYEAMLTQREKVQAAVRAYFAENEVAMLVFPSVGAPPPPIGEEHHVQIDGDEVSFFGAFGRNTALAPAAGLPALSLPAGLSSTGLPVGIELTAPTGADRELLELGAAVERVLEFRGTGRPRLER
jgi:Asp-tRNA(Asn)/Glu-tRNA(Gln) amidotransferase A subunit family amidase